MKSKDLWFGTKEAYASVPKDAVFTVILHGVSAVKKLCFQFPHCNADAVLATV